MLIEQYDPAERALRIIGKGDAEREVYLHADALAHLDRWLLLLNAGEGPMFRPVNRWDQIQYSGPDGASRHRARIRAPHAAGQLGQEGRRHSTCATPSSAKLLWDKHADIVMTVRSSFVGHVPARRLPPPTP